MRRFRIEKGPVPGGGLSIWYRLSGTGYPAPENYQVPDIRFRYHRSGPGARYPVLVPDIRASPGTGPAPVIFEI